MPGPAELVERLAALREAGDVDEALTLLAPDAVFRPQDEARVYHGLEEIRRYAEESAKRPKPSLIGYLVYENGPHAAVLAQLSMPVESRGRSYNEVVTTGWVVTVRDGRVTHLCSYPSWAEAKEAAGITPERERAIEPRRHFPRGLLMRARLRLA